MVRPMSYITITIASTGRRSRLATCLMSIDYSKALINIGAKELKDIPLDILKSMPRVSVMFSHDPVIAVQNSLALCSPYDSHILPIADDIVFKPGAIQVALDALNKLFPDGDGVIGLDVENMTQKQKSPYAFMLIGNKFFNERLKRRMFFPGYLHFFADTELGEAANKIGRFELCKEAKVYHFHPVTGAPADETYLKNREQRLQHDHALFHKRKQGSGILAAVG